MSQEFVRGRVLKKRSHKNVTFLDVRTSGETYQISMKRSLFLNYDQEVRNVGIGDIVEFRGTYFTPPSGTRTLNTESYSLLTKCYSPEKIGIMPSTTIRRNRRGLDLLTSEESRERFKKVAQGSQIIRSFLYERGFIEIDTGVLRKTTDTSKAEEFRTYASWLNRELFLRKSTEQRLKQLMAGGLENIFELGKVFRNEGVSRDFSPEFTALELYMGYANHESLLDLVKDMLKEFDERLGVPDSRPSQFEEMTFYEFIKSRIKEDPKKMDWSDLNSLVPEEKRVDYPPNKNPKGYVLHNLFEGLMKDETKRNLAIVGYPRQITVLSKTFDDDPDISEEFRMFVKGRSYCYGCTELTDFEEQEKRIKEQADFWDKPQDKLDEGFIESLKIGIPPCAGLGLSLERLLAIYLDQNNLNEVIFFPM